MANENLVELFAKARGRQTLDSCYRKLKTRNEYWWKIYREVDSVF